MAMRQMTLLAAALGGLALGTGAFLFNTSASAQAQGQDIGDMLIAGLQQTEGCLRVDTGATASGRNCIFAWFDSKEAAMRWYYSETHQGAMRSLMGGTPGDAHVPMKGVPDDVGPIMVVASLIPAAANELQEVDLPISAIAIELYKPLPAGAFIGSSFGPPEIYGEGMKAYPMDGAE